MYLLLLEVVGANAPVCVSSSATATTFVSKATVKSAITAPAELYFPLPAVAGEVHGGGSLSVHTGELAAEVHSLLYFDVVLQCWHGASR